ncbi:MAG: hypothetical protein RLZZ299_1877 [Pseudomonadota bacterium]|jgi:hypothetical protein
MTNSDFGRAILMYVILLAGGIVVAAGLFVLAYRRSEGWRRDLLHLAGLGLSGTALSLLVDLAWTGKHVPLLLIQGLHGVAAVHVVVRAFRRRTGA